jgi:hypothetical protein
VGRLEGLRGAPTSPATPGLDGRLKGLRGAPTSFATPGLDGRLKGLRGAPTSPVTPGLDGRQEGLRGAPTSPATPGLDGRLPMPVTGPAAPLPAPVPSLRRCLEPRETGRRSLVRSAPDILRAKAAPTNSLGLADGGDSGGSCGVGRAGDEALAEELRGAEDMSTSTGSKIPKRVREAR